MRLLADTVIVGGGSQPKSQFDPPIPGFCIDTQRNDLLFDIPWSRSTLDKCDKFDISLCT